MFAESAERSLRVPHEPAPLAGRAALAAGHVVVVRPVAGAAPDVDERVVNVGRHIELRRGGIVVGLRLIRVKRIQQRDVAGEGHAVAIRDLRHLAHVPFGGAVVVLLHERLAEALAGIIDAAEPAIHVERVEKAARSLLAGAEVEPAHELVLHPGIADIVLAGADAELLEILHRIAAGEHLVRHAGLVVFVAEENVEARLLEVAGERPRRILNAIERVARARVAAAGNAQAGGLVPAVAPVGVAPLDIERALPRLPAGERVIQISEDVIIIRGGHGRPHAGGNVARAADDGGDAVGRVERAPGIAGEDERRG